MSEVDSLQQCGSFGCLPGHCSPVDDLSTSLYIPSVVSQTLLLRKGMSSSGERWAVPFSEFGTFGNGVHGNEDKLLAC